MKLSVVIPTYNRRDTLIETLKAFSRQSYKNFEIIIVDDGSTDGTEEVVKGINLSLKIKYIFQQNKGPASARNLGIKQAKNEIIFFTGDDIIPSENLLEEHINIHRTANENISVLGYTKWAPQIRITPFRKYITDYHFAYPSINDENNVDWGYFYTSNVSIRKKFLEKTELFDEEFPYAAYEDSELGYRLFKNGMRTVFNKKAVAYHNHPINFKSYQKTMFNKGQSSIILAQKIPALEYKSKYKETKNPIRLFFKKLIFSKPIMFLTTEIICFLDKLLIPLPKIIYVKILDYYRVQGIKKATK
ncbi:glycosyltransferase family 2 protein [Patescibacteria group bacterium]|nr:glycosyltransferase family 2 protein [Patescibacteria group bacterium]MBU2579453.1 glycosyltransferase family 2 protein [Patescibacteria group bacterium]MBU4031155.1 glycosyltransferase family 2 protein [Patescibacteria group bacterium]MCG2699741.1 glycosyltransferase family 2 protein [Candidatus Parcubacteria bacterium]